VMTARGTGCQGSMWKSPASQKSPRGVTETSGLETWEGVRVVTIP